MNREDAIKKIRKCMAMAAGASGAEAAAALRQAQALMREHQLDADGVAAANVREVRAKALLQPIISWEANLVVLVAGAFGCEALSSHKKVPDWKGNRAREWLLIGVDASPEIASYVIEALGNQLSRARRAHMAKQSRNCKQATRVARGDAFALGWVQAAAALVERFANVERHDQAVKAYMQQHFPCTTTARVKRRDEGRNIKNSASAGYQAGTTASLHHGVGGLRERQLLGLS